MKTRHHVALISLLVCALALLVYTNVKWAKQPRPEQSEPVIIVGQPEVSAGFVQETTNAQDVTESALNALGYSLSNTVTVSVK